MTVTAFGMLLLSRMDQTTSYSMVVANMMVVASSLQDVFLCGAIVVGIGACVATLLIDIPLRTSNRRSAAAAEPVI